ncbi:MAG TPA: hypothetical protein VLD19_20060 [Chitinophagaceae bacterium]|nr:hypothetical protein [Chitinophagaceae bacterium]
MKHLIVTALVIAAVCMHQRGFAQQTTGRDSLAAVSKDSTAIIDSLMKDFKALVDELVAPKSFFSVGAGLGNRSFSVKNNSLNTQEATTDRLSVTPYAGYYHKSGLGLTLMGYASSLPDHAVGIYQYAITPSYDYVSHRLSAGISYTRYFGKDTALQSTSPYDNDMYAYVNLVRKSWRYGLAIGYATGEFSDKLHYEDSIQRFNNLLQRLQWVHYDVTIHAKEKIRDFSLSASVRKDFQWDDVLKKGDNITLSVVSYLVGGSSKIHTTTNSNVNLNFRKITLQRFRRSYKNDNGNDFQLQSAALCFSVYYTIGKFNISPVWFMDYYFPDASKQYSQVFSLSAGFNF